MIGLGIWQLQRAQWKEGLLAQYAKAEKLPPITWPTAPLRERPAAAVPPRHRASACAPVGQRAVAGENRAGEPGYVHIVDCTTGAEGPGMSVEVGWSKNPNAKVNWAGGPVSGIIAPDRADADAAGRGERPAGLEPSAPPSIDVDPQQSSRPTRCSGSASPQSRLIIYGLAVRQATGEERPKP